jgi:hypothetical protein
MSSESAALALKRLQELRALREQLGQPSSQSQSQYRDASTQQRLGGGGQPVQYQRDSTTRGRPAEREQRANGEELRPAVGWTASREGRDPSMTKAQELLARSAQLRQHPVAAEHVPTPAASAVGNPRNETEQAEPAEQPSQLVHRLPVTSSPAESDATEWSAYSITFDRRASDAGHFGGPPAASALSADAARYQFRGTPTKMPVADPAVASPRRVAPPGSPDEAHPNTGQIQPPADWSGPVLKQMKKTKQWKVRSCRLDAAAGRLQLHDAKKVRKPEIPRGSVL